jgi:hypothetical protein
MLRVGLQLPTKQTIPTMQALRSVLLALTMDEWG